MADVEIRDVRKSFGEVDVLHGIDVQIPNGRFAVIVGPSGCGKSTLLRLIAGLEGLTGGDILIAGRVVNDIEPKDRDIAMVFQNYALYPHMTVRQNMSFGLELRGMGREDIAARVQRAAGILQLGDLLERKPRQLSGGQRQRVAMGRAIVRDPAVFLFDEPLSNLDAKLRVQMRLEIKKLHQELRATSVYVTHDQVEAMTMGDVLIVMNKGRVEQIGAPMEIYHRPASTFVAGFIGSPPMNMLPATARDRELVLEGDIRLPMTLPPAAAGPLTAGIRPEHLELAEAGAAPLLLPVAMVEPQGAETLVHGELAGCMLTARVPGTYTVAAGDRLPLRFAAEHVHLFAADEGQRLN